MIRKIHIVIQSISPVWIDQSYRELQNSGKDLNHDQKTAIAKFGEVVQTLEFAREQYKQFVSIANASEKEAKKQARKDAVARGQSELAKV